MLSKSLSLLIIYLVKILSLFIVKTFSASVTCRLQCWDVA